MNVLKTLTVLAFGSVLLAGCGAKKDESAAQTGTPSPAVETPAPPADTMSPADTTGTMPSDQPAPATSDSLPTDEQPPPEEPAPPPNGFGSAHLGGLQVLMGDGGVRFVSLSTDPGLLRRLAHRKDGQLVSDF